MAVAQMADQCDETQLAVDRHVSILTFDQGSQTLREVNDALRRLDKGDYGICEECGEPIVPKRLEAIPWARYCVGCQDKDHSGNHAQNGTHNANSDYGCVRTVTTVSVVQSRMFEYLTGSCQVTTIFMHQDVHESRMEQLKTSANRPKKTKNKNGAARKRCS